ncbi:MAG TPA: PEP-CTERM system histidine kinase PrsK [Deltaproteobacteria bacterium]|nr:PEP-CTERM system histidine kinase PrsK [Deltaproteobacteria bacterium]HPR54793.1 PEP-CTERM system histidine kinase PrsK [Deltaproteobacteria bacterium]
MTVFIYSFTALVSLLGGLVILSRSGASHGRAIACGLLCIAGTELGYLLFHLRDSLAAIQVASLFELSSISCFIVAVISMEKSLSGKRLLVLSVRRGLFVICVLYAAALWFHRWDYAYFHPSGMVAIGWLGWVQSLLLLAGAISFIWIMENILRSSQGPSRRILKYPALGSISVGASLCIAAIYRLSTNTINQDILLLCSLITLAGIAFLIFFSIRFKLFDMDIFVSRYIVYHSITFISMGAYLLLTGMVILWIQHLGMKASFVIAGFLSFLTLILLFIFFLSPEAKSRVRFFINTHFFANKYDYRKEWGELSGYLSIAFKENQIIDVTAQVILDSMYIQELSMWLRRGNVYKNVLSFPHQVGGGAFLETNPLIAYLRGNHFFMRRTPAKAEDTEWDELVRQQSSFLDENKIEFAVGMMAGNELVGFIAVGKENPGTPYGQDDIDLLTAIASQASSALTKAWFSERLVENKELDTYNRMSATMLHDLKNAAGHLSLILQNAPRYMDQEEFRADMIDTIGQALARIDKVMAKLQTIPEPEEIHPKVFLVGPFLNDIMTRLKPRFDGIELVLGIDEAIRLNTDPDLLDRILENIIVNATEAVEKQGKITVSAYMEGGAPCFSVSDNGSGMTDEFMREKLFKPFHTTKKKGTGLGLWQVKNMADQLGSRVEVSRNPGRGMTFSVWLPPERPGDAEGKA